MAKRFRSVFCDPLKKDVFNLFSAGKIFADESPDGRLLRRGLVPHHGGQQASSHSLQVPFVPGLLAITDHWLLLHFFYLFLLHCCHLFLCIFLSLKKI